MSSFLKNVWDVVGSEITGLLGNEQERQDKVTGLLIDKPFQFGKDIGLYGDKIEVPELINTTNPNNSVKQNAIASFDDSIANMQQDSEVFRKNMPASLFEIGEFGIDLAMNPLKYGKEAIDLGSGFATMPFENIDNLDNEAMAQSVIDSTIEFFKTEGAVRKAALNNPADVLFIMMGGASGIKKLQAMKPETKERMLSVIQRVGATPVGLSMKDVSNTNLSKVNGNTDLVNDGRQLAPVDEAGFYSKAQQTVLDSMPKDLPKEQLRGWFEKRGVSQTELGDLGILDMIDNMGQGDKITKEGLLDHIGEQNLTFKTTVLGGDKSEYDENFGMDRLSDEQNFEISDASAQFRSRYEAINTSNYSGLSNWSKVFDSVDEPDNWLEISGSGWSLSPDSETRAYEYGEEIFADEIGSYSFTAPSADGAIRNTVGADRNKYPFNNIGYEKRQEGEPYEEGFNTDYRDTIDESNLQFTVYMNKINPELYPETKSMELKSLYMELRKRQSTEGETRISPDLRQAMLDATTPENTILEKIAMLEADIMDDVRTGNLEWDMKMLEEANGLDSVYDMEGGNRLKYDMEEAKEMMGRDAYLNDPEFQFDIEVGGEQYRAYGNESIGYAVDTPDEGLRHGLSDFDDIYDIPALETAIREHAIDRGYVNEYFDGDSFDGGDYGDTKWEQFTLNRQNSDAPRENYKENIIQINPDKEQLQGAYQYENDVHYRGVKGLFAHVRSSDRREFGSDANMVKFIEELQSDFQQSRRQLGATKAETEQLKYLNRMESSATGDMESVWSNLIKGMNGKTPEERLLPANATGFNGDLLWKGLTKTKEQKAIYKDAMLAQTDDYLFANFSSSSPDRKKQAREAIKEWDATWGDNPKNPDSPNWEGINIDEYIELGQYIGSHGDALRLTGTKLDSHVHTTRVPIQGDKWYTTALNHEIMKAVEDGKSTLAWANSDQILDQWNPARQTDYKKRIKNKENYVNTYDKKITNAAQKMAKKYGGEFEVIKIDLGNGKFSENFSIRITPLMIENMKKEFPANNKSGFARPTHGKLQQIPTGLLKTDITEQQGLLA